MTTTKQAILPNHSLDKKILEQKLVSQWTVKLMTFTTFPYRHASSCCQQTIQSLVGS